VQQVELIRRDVAAPGNLELQRADGGLQPQHRSLVRRGVLPRRRGRARGGCRCAGCAGRGRLGRPHPRGCALAFACRRV
jgi:hypothetical protein